MIANCGLFALSLGKETCYIFSKFNPLNTDTPIIQKHSMAPSVSILTAEFDNIYSCHDAWPQVNQSFPSHLMLVACYEILNNNPTLLQL